MYQNVLACCVPNVSEYHHEDAQKLLTFLLTGLHDELNGIKTKPDEAMKVDEMGKSEQV